MSGKESNVQATDTETTEEHRLKEIHESKRRCEDVVFQRKCSNASLETLQAAVEQYILSVYPLLLENGESYLTEEYIGTMVVERESPFPANDIEDFSKEFHGLISILNCDSVPVEEVEKQAGRGGGEKRVVREYYVSENVLINAYMITSKFIQELGLGVELEEDRPPAEI